MNDLSPVKTTEDTESDRLPDPGDRPDATLLVFDGHCRICRASMRTLRHLDLSNQLAFLSLHDPRARQLCPDLSHEELMREILLVNRGGHRYRGAKALRAASRMLPTLWPVVPLLHIPGSLPFWSATYQVIARWRYYLGGRYACDNGTFSVH